MNFIIPKILDRRQSPFTSPSFKREKINIEKSHVAPTCFLSSSSEVCVGCTYGDAVDIYSSNGPNIGDPTYTWGDPTEERRN